VAVQMGGVLSSTPVGKKRKSGEGHSERRVRENNWIDAWSSNHSVSISYSGGQERRQGEEFTEEHLLRLWTAP